MRHDLIDEGKRWLAQALNDIDDARYNQKGGRYHLACFLSQQAAEKALKAFLYMNGEDRVWGHSVAELCRRVAEIDASFKSIRREVATLDRHYIPTRYPNSLPGGIPSEVYEEADAERAINIADTVIKMVKAKMDVVT